MSPRGYGPGYQGYFFRIWGHYPQYIHTGYPNGLNPNVTVGRNNVGIVAPGDSGP